jgi:hypothetical protein
MFNKKIQSMLAMVASLAMAQVSKDCCYTYSEANFKGEKDTYCLYNGAHHMFADLIDDFRSMMCGYGT